jgi:cytochrome c biogenesis factor
VTVVGELALWIALFLAVWGSAASIAGAKLGRPELLASGRRSIVATAAMLAVACLGLWAALLSHEFSLQYVAAHTTRNTPTAYLVTAFWAGPPGRMLFFAFALAFFGALAVVGERRLDAPVRIWIAGTIAALLTLVLIVVCFGTNPYDPLEWVPAEGQGLDPRLQTPLALLYFVATYAAYGVATVVLALAVGAAVVGRVDEAWIAALRRWSLVCWCLLTAAIAVRMRWTYLELESGGFRGLDGAQLTSVLVWALSLVVLWMLGRSDDGASARPTRSRIRLAATAVFLCGLAMLGVGVAASSRWTGRTVSVRPGEVAELTDPFGGRWRFVSQGASRDEQMNYLSTSVAVDAWRDGEHAGILSAERRQYLDSIQRPTFDPTVKPGIRSLPTLDAYVVLSGLRQDAADLRIGFRPLVSALWIGWLLVAAGGLAIAALGTRGGVTQRAPATSSR